MTSRARGAVSVLVLVLVTSTTACATAVVAPAPITQVTSGSVSAKLGASGVLVPAGRTFQIALPFEQSDAARLIVGQVAEVLYDDLPDLVSPAKIVSVDSAVVMLNGVPNRYATALITKSDPRLRAGMTTFVDVGDQPGNASLVVPNSAVIRIGKKTFVVTAGPDGKPRWTFFQAGSVGDNNTQVLSGLTEGQAVQLPQQPAKPGDSPFPGLPPAPG